MSYFWDSSLNMHGPSGPILQKQLKHTPWSLIAVYISNHLNSPGHLKPQKNSVNPMTWGRKLNWKEAWGGSTWTPISSSLDLQWTLSVKSPPKSFVTLTCVFGIWHIVIGNNKNNISSIAFPTNDAMLACLV